MLQPFRNYFKINKAINISSWLDSIIMQKAMGDLRISGLIISLTEQFTGGVSHIHNTA